MIMITSIREAIKYLKAFKEEYKCEAELVLGDRGYSIIVSQTGLPTSFWGMQVRGP